VDMRQLQQFLAIVDAGTITGAATKLFISQPTLSQALIAFERELGVPLFLRRARKMELTAAGEALVEPSRRALRALNDAEQAVIAVSGVSGGRLEVVAPSALLTYPLAQLTGMFLLDHPRVQMRITEARDSDDVSERVADGRAELGILDSARCSPDLTAVHLVDYEIFFAMPSGYPFMESKKQIALEDIQPVPLVASPPGTVSRRLIDSACPEIDVRVQTSSIDAVLAHIVNGSGAGLLIAPYAERAAAAGARLLSLTPPVHREVVIAFRGTEPAPAVRAFLDVALRSMKSTSQRLSKFSRVVD
jgi:DNA-binding transcriptional LysR family regulator